ncbi:putative phosphatase regulatory subunit-domain-containing protein [Mycena floridula]|nr:putative phosphatase regulatory subunit-domain-containing protein [Mycena floridula]
MMLGRPTHHRSFSTEKGHGAFASLGSLPRRTSYSSTTSSNSAADGKQGNPSRPAHKFHLDDSESSEDEFIPALKLKPGAALRSPSGISGNFGALSSPRTSPNSSSTNVAAAVTGKKASFTPSNYAAPKIGVPFPSAAKEDGQGQGPSIVLTLPSATQPSSARPSPSRTSSTPILLSNGRPLKSSLKGTRSASSITHSGSNSPASGPATGVVSAHLRAQSAPSTPSMDLLASTPDSLTPSTPKNVHFPSLPTDLERVRLFSRSAKPINVSRSMLGEETETETETDGNAGFMNGYLVGASHPRSHNSATHHASSHPGSSSNPQSIGYPFPVMSTPIPSYTLAFGRTRGTIKDGEMVVLESLNLEEASSGPSAASPMSPSGSPSLHLHGTLLVRNVSFEKHVAVRFTMDGWATTSEVGATYLSPYIPPSVTLGDLLGASTSSVDRFQFSIRLGDYVAPLSSASPHSSSKSRTILGTKNLMFALRYVVPGQGEWWDNCEGKNWSVGFIETDGTSETNSHFSVKEPLAEEGKKMVSLDVPEVREDPEDNLLSPVAPRDANRFGTTNDPWGEFGIPSTKAPGYAFPRRTGSDPGSIAPGSFLASSSEGSFQSGGTAPRDNRSRQALANATSHRLKGFVLSNYVAPRSSGLRIGSMGSPSSPPGGRVPFPSSGTTSAISDPVEKEESRSRALSMPESIPLPSPLSPSLESSLASLPGLERSRVGSVSSESSCDEPFEDPTPQLTSTSPSILKSDSPSPPFLQSPLLVDPADHSMEAEPSMAFPEALLPVLEEKSVDSAIRRPDSPLENDLLYKAFVERWCFGGGT